MTSTTIDQHHHDCGCVIDYTNQIVIKCKTHTETLFAFYKPQDPKPPEASAHFIIHSDGRIEQKLPIDGSAWRKGNEGDNT